MWFFFSIKSLVCHERTIFIPFFFLCFLFRFAHSLWNGEKKKITECVRILRNFIPSLRAVQTVCLQPKTVSKEIREKVKIAWEVRLLGLFKKKQIRMRKKNSAHENWWGRNNNYWTKFYRPGRCHTAEQTKELLLRAIYYWGGFEFNTSAINIIIILFPSFFFPLFWKYMCSNYLLMSKTRTERGNISSALRRSCENKSLNCVLKCAAFSFKYEVHSWFLEVVCLKLCNFRCNF